MATKPRNYKKEYEEYHGKKEQIERRSARNKSVRALNREGAGDGKDVHHKDGNPKNRKRGNMVVIPRSKNRSMK